MKFWRGGATFRLYQTSTDAKLTTSAESVKMQGRFTSASGNKASDVMLEIDPDDFDKLAAAMVKAHPQKALTAFACGMIAAVNAGNGDGPALRFDATKSIEARVQ